MNTTLKGVLLTLLAAVCWGFSGVAGEILMADGDITSAWLVPVRLLSAGVILIVHQFLTNKSHIFDIFKTKRDIIDLLVYSILGIMLCQYTYFYAIQYSNAGTATVLQYISPVIILALTCFAEKRIPHIKETMCVAMALLGVFIIATHCNFSSFAMSKRALVVGLISAVAVVIYTLQPVRLMQRYSSLYLLTWAFVIGGAFLAVTLKFWRFHIELNFFRLCLVAVTSVIGSIFGYALYLCGLRTIGGAKACLICTLEPVSAAIFSAIFVHTAFTIHDIIGFSLIIITVAILSFDKQDKNPSQI